MKYIVKNHPDGKHILVNGQIQPRQWDFREGGEQSVFPLKSQQFVIKFLKKIAKDGAVKEVEPNLWEFIVNEVE
jgi:hypothetical protein